MTLIDNCDVEKLIAAVQCRRPIYDNSAKEHGSRGLLEHLWNEVAEEMNAPVNKCKAKWQQLRNSFVRSYRGTSGYGKKRKKWYLHDALSFMEEHIQLHKLDDGIYSDDRALEEYELEEKTNIVESYNDTKIEAESAATPPYSPTYFQHSVSTIVHNLQKPNDNSSYENCETQDIPMPPKLQPIPQIQPIPPKYVNISNPTNIQPTSEENPLLNFCKGILPEYDRLSAERQRKFKTEILNCLNRHLDEQEKETERILLETNSNNDRTNSIQDDELRNQFKSE